MSLLEMLKAHFSCRHDKTQRDFGGVWVRLKKTDYYPIIQMEDPKDQAYVEEWLEWWNSPGQRRQTRISVK